jgi:hypothetical protein
LLQLLTGVAFTGKWIGEAVQKGVALYLSAEDELDEIHRRADTLNHMPALNPRGVAVARWADSSLVARKLLTHRHRLVQTNLRRAMLVCRPPAGEE